jgi:hypothetical protein
LDPDGLGPKQFNSTFSTVTIPPPAAQTKSTNVSGHLSIPAQAQRTVDAEPEVAYDRSGGPHSGRVYLVYTDAPSVGSADTNTFVRFSDDNGKTWSARVRVNDDAGATSQFFPKLAVDQGTGQLAVTWLDCRNDAVNNVNTEMFGTVSLDGGVTFLPNVQIAAQPSTSAPSRPDEYGDYSGVAFVAGKFFADWPDNSNSTNDNPNGAGNLANLYTASVTVNSEFNFSSSTFATTKSAGSITITVTRNGGIDTTTAVNFATSNGTAMAGTDYTDTSGTLFFIGHVTSQTFNIPILNGAGNGGTVNLTLSSPTNGSTLGSTSTAVLTINKQQMQFSRAVFNGVEPGTVTVTVVRIGGTSGTSTIDFATSDGLLSTSGTDYTANTGTLTFNPGDTSKTFNVAIVDDGCNCPEDNQTINLTLSNPTGTAGVGSQSTAVVSINEPVFVTAPDAGGGPDVKVFDQTGKFLIHEFLAYAPTFTGGVRVATADVNGDGIPDIITAPGPGNIGSEISVFDGQTGKRFMDFQAYNAGFNGGVYVAAADLNGDGFADIITGPGAGFVSGPDVRVFDGKTGAKIMDFSAYNQSFQGGVRVAAGDVNGDGVPDIITAPGSGMAPEIRVFDGTNGNMIRDFMAYDPTFTGGVFVAAGDTNADGNADIITGPDAGMAPNVKVFSGKDSSVLQNFMAYSAAFTGGVRVGAADVNVSGADGKADILTAPGSGGGPNLKAFDGSNATKLDDFFAYNASLLSGVFVGGH